MSAPGQPDTGIAAQAVHFRYQPGQMPVLEDITLRVPEGKITALIGPNGSGKSTFLKILARQLRPDAGSAVLDGKAIHSLPARDFARSLAILFQEHPIPGDTTVEDLVRFGRYPYSALLQSPTTQDHEAVEGALRLAQLLELRKRPVSDLSGGQRQLAWVAMALAQETRYLFLDEPTTFLDLAHQFDLMDLVQSLNRTLGKTIVLVLHDLSLAARYADHLVVLQQGRIYAEGAPADVLTAATLREVFEVEARILRDEDGVIHCLPTGKAEK